MVGQKVSKVFFCHLSNPTSTFMVVKYLQSVVSVIYSCTQSMICVVGIMDGIDGYRYMLSPFRLCACMELEFYLHGACNRGSSA